MFRNLHYYTAGAKAHATSPPLFWQLTKKSIYPNRAVTYQLIMGNLAIIGQSLAI